MQRPPYLPKLSFLKSLQSFITGLQTYKPIYPSNYTIALGYELLAPVFPFCVCLCSPFSLLFHHFQFQYTKGKILHRPLSVYGVEYLILDMKLILDMELKFFTRGYPGVGKCRSTSFNTPIPSQIRPRGSTCLSNSKFLSPCQHGCYAVPIWLRHFCVLHTQQFRVLFVMCSQTC